MLSADNQKMAMTLGYLTETGEYPEDPNRTNQDSFIGKFAFPNPFVPSPFHFPSFFAHIWLAVIRDFNNDPSSLFLSARDLVRVWYGVERALVLEEAVLGILL